jgi:iron complex outermembrane receptor protein
VYPVEGLDIFGNYAYNRTFLRNAEGRVQEARTSRHKLNAGIQYRAPFGLDIAIDVHYVTTQNWSEQDFDAAGNLRFVELVVPAYYLVNARVGWRFLDDRLDLGVVGYNITNNEHREHPFGQILSARVMGSLSYKF